MIRVVLASVVAALVALNDERKVVFQVKGPKFGLLDKASREIDCGKEWCKVFGINNLGWSLGTGTTRIQYRLWGVVRIHVLVGKRAAIQPG